MPSFAKNPKFIIGTLVVLWVAYIIYRNFQVDMVTFYLLPFDILNLQLKLSAIAIGAALFGALVTLAIQWLWRRSSKSAAPTAGLSAPSSKTVA